MMVLAKQSIIDSVGAAVTVVFSGAKVALYTNNFTPTVDSVLSDFTEADYTGYTAGGIAITPFGTAAWASQGAAVAYGSLATFNPTNPTTVGNIIYGYFIFSGGTPQTLVGAERFASPIPMQSAADQINIVVPYGIGDPGIPGVIF